jgi:Cu+-exporting ATPase
MKKLLLILLSIIIILTLSLGCAKKAPQTVKDLVCNMDVNPAKAKWSHEHNGKTYYFCSQDCSEKFKAEPEKYLAK